VLPPNCINHKKCREAIPDITVKGYKPYEFIDKIIDFGTERMGKA
jgi:hypothetical protein